MINRLENEIIFQTETDALRVGSGKRVKIEIQEDWDQLSKDAVTASNAGISYGQLMAIRYEKEKNAESLAEYHRKKRMEEDREGKHCKCCGVRLTGRRSGRAEFCSEGCKAKWEREHWAEINKKVCTICGKSLSRRQVVYCSEECREKKRREKAKQWYRDKHPERRCKICGGQILENNRIKFCSGACEDINKQRYQEQYRKKMQEIRGIRTCKVCGEPLTGKKQMYCGSKCRNKAEYEKTKKR